MACWVRPNPPTLTSPVLNRKVPVFFLTSLPFRRPLAVATLLAGTVALGTSATASAEPPSLSISNEAVAKAIDDSLPDPADLSFEAVTVTDLTVASSNGLRVILKDDHSIRLQSQMLARVIVTGTSSDGGNRAFPGLDLNLYFNDFAATLDPATMSGTFNLTLRLVNKSKPLLYTARFRTIRMNRVWAFPFEFDTEIACSGTLAVDEGGEVILKIGSLRPSEPDLRVGGDLDTRFGPEPRWVMTLWSEHMRISVGPFGIRLNNPLRSKLEGLIGDPIKLGNLPNIGG